MGFGPIGMFGGLEFGGLGLQVFAVLGLLAFELGLLASEPLILRGSWDLVTRVISKVNILITTYNPN